MPGPASRLYAQNVVNLVTLMTRKDEDGNGVFSPDYSDEILSGSCVTQDGRIVHEATREAIEGRAERVPVEPVPAEPVPVQPRPPDSIPAEQSPAADLPYDQEADQ
jgi:H+-translocating NAD(P) transhydrogenase subunit alpha